VLCLVDPFAKSLMLRPAEGATTPLDPHSEAARPMALELEDGAHCRARNGGSWSVQEQHPNYVGAFSCEGGSVHADYLGAWSGPGDDSGITKNSDGWTVQVGGATGPLTTLKVTKAYYVGVA
jgi:hypothetical protein